MGADLDAETSDGKTPLEIAKFFGNFLSNFIFKIIVKILKVYVQLI